MTDTRPQNCRFRLQDEGRAYPRSSCQACGKSITTGLGTHCRHSMTENAPERIWAKPEHPDENGYGGFWIKAQVAPAVEYIRADLYTAVCAERDALIEGRDMMGRLWEKEKARAEKAEADVEKWKKAFTAQSRKLQSVLHIEGVREALQEKPDD